MRQDLVMLPGLLLDRRLWAAQEEALSDLASVHIPDLSQEDDLSILVAKLLTRLPERFALAGLSMGGYVAFELLRQAPERISRLALLDTNAWPDTPAVRAQRRSLIGLADRGAFHGVTQRLLRQLLHPERLAEGHLESLIMAMAKSIGPDGFKRQQTAILGRADFSPLLPRIAVPTLVLCGEADSLTPPARHREMAIAIQKSRLVIVPGAGHLPPLERPAETSAVLRQWLIKSPEA
ncbi:MAG: alpha/beta hydrolase [Rhodospirillales bacterium]